VTGSSNGRTSISGDGASAITAEVIAALVSGELIGDAGTEVKGVAPLDRAESTDLSILSSGKYTPMMATTKAGVVLVDPEHPIEIEPLLSARSPLPHARLVIAPERTGSWERPDMSLHQLYPTAMNVRRLLEEVK